MSFLSRRLENPGYFIMIRPRSSPSLRSARMTVKNKSARRTVKSKKQGSLILERMLSS